MNKAMLLKQYLSYHKKSSSRLPSEYQEVEYIESTGTQYIDTGYKINDNKVKIQIKFRITDWNESGFYFGCGYVGESNAFTASTSYLAIGANSISAFPNQDSMVGVINYLEMEANENTKQYSYSINNGTSVTGSYSGTIKSNLSMPIFKGTLYSGSCDCRVYSFRLYANDVLQRDFIPCYRKSDNEIGLYDIVNNQIYTNSGSGSFLKGKDVIYTPTNAVSFATDSWSTIQAEAERISNFYEKYGFIPFNTPYAIYNPENNDTNNIRTIMYNNEEIQIAIIGMCHDTLQTPYSGGGTKAGITWQTTKSLFKSAVDSSNSSGGWSSCSLRTSLNSTHYNSLPQEMQNAIKVVSKKSNNGSGSITTSNDKLFTLSMVEIMGTTKRNSSTNLAIEGEGTQYEYYKNAPLIKDSNNITWTGLSGTKGTCIANGNSYTTLIGGVQTPDANDYINYRNAKEYKPNGNASYYGTRSFRETYNECMYVWRAGNITFTTASNSDLEVCFAGCI